MMAETAGDTTDSTWQRRALQSLALVVLCAVAYFPSLRGPFLRLDDQTYISQNLTIASSDHGLWEIWSGQTADYCPLTYTLIWIQWHNSNHSPLVFHVVNLAMHVASTLLLFAFLREWKVALAWFAAAAWAIHPINTATVAWIIHQNNTLSMLLALCGALALTDFLKRGKKFSYAAALAFTAASALAKPAAVLMSVVLLLLLWWREGKMTWRRALPFLPVLAVAILPIWIAARLQIKSAALGHTQALSLAGRFIHASKTIAFFVHQTFWPSQLAIFHPQWSDDPARWTNYVPLIVIALLLAMGLIIAWRKHRGPLVLMASFILLLAPILGFIDLAFWYISPVADHWVYFALPVLMCGIAWCMSKFPAPLRYGVCTIALAILFTMTFQRSHLFADELALWQDNAQKDPDCFAVYNNIAIAAAERGRWDEAESAAAKAVQLAPDSWPAYQTYSWILKNRGKSNQAIAAYRRLIELEPERRAEFEAEIDQLQQGRGSM